MALRFCAALGFAGALLVGCGTTAVRQTTTAATGTPTPSSATPSIGSLLDTPTPSALADAALSGLDKEVAVLWLTIPAGGTTVQEDCKAFLADRCAATLTAFRVLLADTTRALAGAAGSTSPGDPSAAPVASALAHYDQAAASLSRANSTGDKNAANSGDSGLDQAYYDLQDAIQPFPTASDAYLTLLQIAPTPIPDILGTGPAAASPMTTFLEAAYASLDPLAVAVSSACAVILSDACAAAVAVFKTAIDGQVGRFRGIAAPRGYAQAATAAAVAVFELEQAAVDVMSANEAGTESSPAGFGLGLLSDGVAQLRKSVVSLRS